MDTRESDDPIYRAMVAAFVADKRNRVIPTYGIRRKRIDLTNALVDERFDFKGDFLYADYNSTGVIEVRLNSVSEDPFPLLALAGVTDLPFEGIHITSSAQAGLFINIWYGYYSRFISPTSAISTIGSITNPVKIQDSFGNSLNAIGPMRAAVANGNSWPVVEQGFGYGAAYANTAVLAANTAVAAVAPASNVNGAIVWAGYRMGLAATMTFGGLLAKSAAPANIADGDVLLGSHSGDMGSSAVNAGHVTRAVFAASGKGLYWISAVLESSGYRSLKYTLL